MIIIYNIKDMSLILKEELVEDLISKTLEELGYEKYNTHFNKDNLTIVVDFEELKRSLIRINKNLEIEYIENALEKVKKLSATSFDEGNFQTLKWLKEGIGIKIDKISNVTKQVKLIDLENIDNNVFKYIRQMQISVNTSIRRPDIVIYLNGLPISLIELKSPEAKEKLKDAYEQVVFYAKSQDNFMYWNIFSCVSNCFLTKYGAATSEFNHWWSWKKTNFSDKIIQDKDFKEDEESALNNYHKHIVGIYNRKTLLNLLKNYVFFAKSKNRLIKYIPTYYQYYAVEKSIKSIENAQHGRAGVVWHTQGSGKSVTMLFLAHRIKTYFKNQNYKIIFVTDRNELDDQLYVRFDEAHDYYLYTKPIKITSRKDLKEKLSNDDDFGIYMTTIQKFTESTEPLSMKDNVIIIADEAHRSHNNIEIDYVVDKTNKEIIEKEGYAKYMRDAFPNAKFIGFTGTPLKGDKKTTDIFGGYIDQYTMSQSELDGSTVPIHYEKRRVEILLDKYKLPELDELYSEEEKSFDSDYIKHARYEHIKKKLIKVSEILAHDDVIKMVVTDFWKHYDDRARALHGKIMFVAFNRNIAYLIYREMVKQRPNWAEKIRLVITGSNKDNEELTKLVPSEEEKRKIASEFKKDNSSIKIAVVVDMWLTGFDVPDLDTLYLFKVIKWHNLMQTIARVNRTYNGEKNKEDGLIVDYIGIWKHISDALKEYAGDSKKEFDIDKVKISLLDFCLKIKKQFFEKQENIIISWIKSDNKEKFDWMIEGVKLIEKLSKKDKDLFFALVSKISRCYKLCSQILDKAQKLEAQLYILIKNFIRTTNVEEAVDIQKTLDKLKSKMDEIVQTGNIEVSRVLMDGKKDLSYVYSLLEKELKTIKENKELKDELKPKMLEQEMKNQIKIFSRTNPLKAQKLSEDLKMLVAKYEQDKNLEEMIDGLQKMAQIMIEDKELNKIMGDDENLQKFYSVLADERFKLQNQSSEILREITLKIVNLIKDVITPQWWTNQKIRDVINNKIKLLLKTEYNYPPENAKDASKIMIDEIDNIIRVNPKYFIDEHER